MTNGDKYLKDEDMMFELGTKLKEFITENWKGLNLNTSAIYDFFGQEVKPTLTEDEKVILRNTNKNYTLIGRENGNTTLYMQDRAGECYERIFLYAFDHLFQFIQPRRRI